VTTSAEHVRLAGLDSPDVRSGGGRQLTRSLAFAGLRAAGTAAGAGLAMMTILVLVGWIAAPHLRFGLMGVLRTAAVLWLVGHHVAVNVKGAGRIGMLPLGLVLLPGISLWWAGRSVTRGRPVTEPRQVMVAALAVAVPYSLIAGALAIASRSALAQASLSQAAFAGFAVAFVAAWLGAARALASWRKLGALMSGRSRSVLVGLTGSLAVLGAAGLLTTAAAVANHERQFTAVYSLLGPGVIGGGLLLLAQLAYLPNAVLWAVAYMLGPGFAVGIGTVVSPTGSVVGPLPAFPLLTALPVDPHGTIPRLLAAVMLAIPYLAGVIGGLLVVRQDPRTAVDTAVIRGFCCGAAGGAVLGVLAAFSGGPLGDGRLSAVGPSPWQVAVVATLELGVAAAVSAGAVNWWYGRTRRFAQAPQPTRPARMPSDETDGMPATRPSVSTRGDGQDGGHVIFLDQWADEKEAADHPKRPRGPSSLP
jgi:hypothetical protein